MLPFRSAHDARGAGYPLSGVSDWDFRLAKLTDFAVVAGADLGIRCSRLESRTITYHEK